MCCKTSQCGQNKQNLSQFCAVTNKTKQRVSSAGYQESKMAEPSSTGSEETDDEEEYSFEEEEATNQTKESSDAFMSSGRLPKDTQSAPGRQLSSMTSIRSEFKVLDKIIITDSSKHSKWRKKVKGTNVDNGTISATCSGVTLDSEGVDSAGNEMSYERFDEVKAGSSKEVQIELAGTDGKVTISADFIMDPAVSLGSLGMLRLRINRFINHIAFRFVTLLLICTDFTIVIIDLAKECNPDFTKMEIAAHIIICYFVVEVFLRMFSVGLVFFKNGVEVFDFIVILSSFIISTVFLALGSYTDDTCSGEQYVRLLVIGRIFRVVRIVRITYVMFQQRRHVQTATRQLISQNKRRYQRDGFDLDLCYITERVIAMSFPSKGMMATYRNPVEEVARFFNTKHEDHYKIYNLCSERSYNEALFHHNVRRIYIDDHNVPTVSEMLKFTEELREWMAADDKNIVAIHCKGGKGRTGTMICVWLIDCGIFDEAKDCLEYFGDRRTDLTKGSTFQGVETPSQSRYVGYYEKCVRLFNRTLPPKKVLKLKVIKITGIKTVGHGDGSDFTMEMWHDHKVIFHCNLKHQQACIVKKFPDEDYILIEIESCPNLEGDIKTMFKTVNKARKIYPHSFRSKISETETASTGNGGVNHTALSLSMKRDLQFGASFVSTMYSAFLCNWYSLRTTVLVHQAGFCQERLQPRNTFPSAMKSVHSTTGSTPDLLKTAS